MKPISDPTAIINALQAGDIDVTQLVAPNDVATVAGDPNLVPIDRGSACNVGVLAMNQTHKPFDNPKIRQAVAYAVDRKAIVERSSGAMASSSTAGHRPARRTRRTTCRSPRPIRQGQGAHRRERRDRSVLRLLVSG